MLRAPNVIAFCTVLMIGAPPPAAAAAATSANGAAVAPHRLFRAAWQREIRGHPLEASADGFHQYDGSWADDSLANLAREHQEDLEALKRLAAIDGSRLDRAARISFDLFSDRYEIRGNQTLCTLTHTLRLRSRPTTVTTSSTCARSCSTSMRPSRSRSRASSTA